MDPDLKPCPFCGSMDNATGFNVFGQCWVHCQTCGTRGPRFSGERAYEKSREAWNARAVADPDGKTGVSDSGTVTWTGGGGGDGGDDGPEESGAPVLAGAPA